MLHPNLKLKKAETNIPTHTVVTTDADRLPGGKIFRKMSGVMGVAGCGLRVFRFPLSP